MAAICAMIAAIVVGYFKTIDENNEKLDGRFNHYDREVTQYRADMYAARCEIEAKREAVTWMRTDTLEQVDIWRNDAFNQIDLLKREINQLPR